MAFLLKGRKVEISENFCSLSFHLSALSWLMECWRYYKKVKAQKDGRRLHPNPPYINLPVNTYCAFMFYVLYSFITKQAEFENIMFWLIRKVKENRICT